MALTIDCGEGKHEVCSGVIHGASYLLPQTSDYPDRECACRCHPTERPKACRHGKTEPHGYGMGDEPDYDGGEVLDVWLSCREVEG